MSYERLLCIVSEHACTSAERAAQATQAILETLAERIPAAESHALRDHLPPDVARWVSTSNPADRFGFDEFLHRVADRESVDVETAEWHARAVLETVGQAVGEREYECLEAQLSEDYRPLFGVLVAGRR